MNMSKKHQGRKSPLARPTAVKRIPASFGWSLLKQLSVSLSPYLPAELVGELDRVSRKRDMATYLALGDKWSSQWTSDLLEVRAPYYAAAAYLVCKVLNKTEGMEWKDGVTRRGECLDRVIKLDQKLDPMVLHSPEDPVFRRAQRWVCRILGSCPTSDELSALARHGPGSTALTSYKDRSTYFKYANWPYGVSPSCKSLLKELITADSRWFGSLEQDYRKRNDIDAWSVLDWDAFWQAVFTDTRYNVITSVPKNGAKDRPIAKEPLGNVYCQTAVGQILKDRIKTAIGIDLTSQDRNREMARLASMWNHLDSYCTFDLSDASDTISADLVRELLNQDGAPRDWWALLSSIRSDYGLVPNAYCWRYSKMSSMGNATTFELESIVFASVILSVIDEFGLKSDRSRFSVFGDDLVFPRYLNDHMRIYLEAFGFKVNESKSFHNGMFFESCGADWLNGFNIRPVFLRRIPETAADLFTCHNQLQSWFVRVFGTLAPSDLRKWILAYCDFDVTSFEGPFHSGSNDSWVFSNRNPRCHQILASEPISLSCKDIWFRKLMHDLKVCDSESGSRFTVSDKSRTRRSRRYRCSHDPFVGVLDYTGQIQDLAWPAWEEISHVSQGQP